MSKVTNLNPNYLYHDFAMLSQVISEYEAQLADITLVERGIIKAALMVARLEMNSLEEKLACICQ